MGLTPTSADAATSMTSADATGVRTCTRSPVPLAVARRQDVHALAGPAGGCPPSQWLGEDAVSQEHELGALDHGGGVDQLLEAAPGHQPTDVQHHPGVGGQPFGTGEGTDVARVSSPGRLWIVRDERDLRQSVPPRQVVRDRRTYGEGRRRAAHEQALDQRVIQLVQGEIEPRSLSPRPPEPQVVRVVHVRDPERPGSEGHGHERVAVVRVEDVGSQVAQDACEASLLADEPDAGQGHAAAWHADDIGLVARLMFHQSGGGVRHDGDAVTGAN